MGDEWGKDEVSVSVMFKKYEILEVVIVDYFEIVNEFGDIVKVLVDSGYLERYCVNLFFFVEELIYVRILFRSVVKEFFVYGSLGVGIF